MIPPENEPSMIVLDGGGAFNDPFPPLLRQERRVDVLIVFDDSSEPNQLVNPFGVSLFSNRLVLGIGFGF